MIASAPSLVVGALWLWFAGWALALAIVDIREHRLPNAMVAAAFTGCVLITTVGAIASGQTEVVVRASAASCAAIVVFALAHVFGGMGMGDVKYAAVTGWVLGTVGWWAVWWGHLLGFVVAGAVVVIGLVTRAMGRRSAVPFGPFMGVGALMVGVGAAMSPIW